MALGEKNIKIEFDLILTCKKFEEEQEKNKPKPLSDLIGIPGPSGVTFGPKR